MAKPFESCAVGTLTLKNRIIRAATHEGLAEPNGKPQNELYELYARLAKGGVGAIITGYVAVSAKGRAYANQGMFDHDSYIDEYRARNAEFKKNAKDTPLLLQIAHAGSQTRSATTGAPPQAVMAKKNYFGEACQPLSSADIEGVIQDFVQATVRAKEAEFDGVELHAAHGYLLSEFISPLLNKRKDEWGGNVENRFRIVREILKQARKLVGDFPIWIKVSAFEPAKNRRAVEELIQGCSLLAADGCDALEISCGYAIQEFDTVRTPHLPLAAVFAWMPEFQKYSSWQKYLFERFAPLLVKKYRPFYNYNVEAAALFKSQLNIPIVVVGGIRRLADICEIFEKEKVDCVSLSRPLILEPLLINKFKEGKATESKCIDCGFCAIAVASDKKIKCYRGKL